MSKPGTHRHILQGHILFCCCCCLLLQLDLRGNGLGNDGAIITGRGLRTAESRVLGELDLGYNEIKDDGACALAQVGGRPGGRMVCGGA